MGVQLELSQHGGNGDRCVWRWDAGGGRATHEEGWDVMAVAWTTSWLRAVGRSGRGDHTLGAPDRKARKGDRCDTCQARGGRCAAQQRSVPCRWWTGKSRRLQRHPMGRAGGRQAPPRG